MTLSLLERSVVVDYIVQAQGHAVLAVITHMIAKKIVIQIVPTVLPTVMVLHTAVIRYAFRVVELQEQVLPFLPYPTEIVVHYRRLLQRMALVIHVPETHKVPVKKVIYATIILAL